MKPLKLDYIQNVPNTFCKLFPISGNASWYISATWLDSSFSSTDGSLTLNLYLVKYKAFRRTRFILELRKIFQLIKKKRLWYRIEQRILYAGTYFLPTDKTVDWNMFQNGTLKTFTFYENIICLMNSTSFNVWIRIDNEILHSISVQ